MDSLLTLDAPNIASSKQLSFPLTINSRQNNFQSALTTTWQMVNTLRQALLANDLIHGKLLLTDFNEEISLDSGQFSFQRLVDGQVQLELKTNVQLVFDFQSTLWQRLEAISATMDYLQQVCQLQSTDACSLTLNNAQK